MSTATVILNAAILVFVLGTGLGTRELTRRRFRLPLVVVAIAGALYLQSVPASTGAIELITVLGLIGILLGVLAGALMPVRHREDGSLVTVAGTSYAAVWVAVIAARMLFAYGANHWFAPQVVDLSRSLGINGSAAWTSALVIMALAMVLTRIAVTAIWATRAGGITWGDRGAVVRLNHSHHRHAH